MSEHPDTLPDTDWHGPGEEWSESPPELDPGAMADPNDDTHDDYLGAEWLCDPPAEPYIAVFVDEGGA